MMMGGKPPMQSRGRLPAMSIGEVAAAGVENFGKKRASSAVP